MPDLKDEWPSNITRYDVYEYRDTAEYYEYVVSCSLIEMLDHYREDIIRDGNGLYSACTGYVLVLRQDVSLEKVLKWYQERFTV